MIIRNASSERPPALHLLGLVTPVSCQDLGWRTVMKKTEPIFSCHTGASPDPRIPQPTPQRVKVHTTSGSLSPKLQALFHTYSVCSTFFLIAFPPSKDCSTY